MEKNVKKDATFKANAVAARDKLFDVSSGDASGEVDYVDPVTNEHIKGTIQKTKESMKSSWDDSEMYMKVAQRIPCI